MKIRLPNFDSDRVATISHAMVENSLRMRSMAFLSQVKMSLLLDTLKETDEPLNYMRRIRDLIVVETDDWLALPVMISEEARELQQMTLTMERRREELRHFLADQMHNLRQSEMRFHQLFELMPDAVGIHQDGLWIFVNPAAAVAFGADSTDDLVGTPVLDRVHPDDRDKVMQRIRDQVISGEAAPLVAERLLKLDGSMFWGEVQSRLFMQGGQPSVLVMMRDITVRIETERENRRQQQQLEHTQRLESLGVLAGGIAHDFNNILTAIMGNAAMAGRQMDDADPARALLSHIESASLRAADLCKQMLAYAGKGKFVVKPVNLSALVEEMTQLMEVSIKKHVVIKYHLAKHLPIVKADVAQIQQIILNLITNANEAIGDKSGVISFTTGVMHADSAYLKQAVSGNMLSEGHYVFAEVSDTGCGMDAETMRKLFDPFFTTKFTGRGLGMSAVLGIVRGHSGALRVYSELGKGSTFKLLLPVSEDFGDSRIEPEETILAGRISGTVLVVDDEEAIREVATMMLEDMGLDTLTAENGLQGVEVYRQHQDTIIAVLLDMTMPKMGGSGCFRELRRINPVVKVILSSGYNEEEAMASFVGKGLAGFIQKPYSPEALKTIVQECLGEVNIDGK